MELEGRTDFDRARELAIFIKSKPNMRDSELAIAGSDLFPGGDTL
jgi:hypothetical protein